MGRQNTENTGIHAPPKVFSYTRISTAYKQLKGRGSKRQDEGATAWCKENGHRLESANCFSDLGVSGWKGKNAEQGELRVILDLIAKGSIASGDILIVESLDRLSRQNINIAVQLLLGIINAGVVVVTLVDKAVYRADVEPQQLMASLMMSVAIFMRANDESRTKSMRKADSWKKKREAARHDGSTLSGKTPKWIRVVDGKYVVIEQVAQRVRAVFGDYVTGSGLYLLHKKYRIPKATIRYWLTNPVVIGTILVTEEGVTTEIPNHYPAIVDVPIFRAAKQKQAERYIERRAGRTGAVNLFAGILVDPAGNRFDQQRHYGFPSYVSSGMVIQASMLEQVICRERLFDKFVVTEYLEDATPDPELLKIEKKIVDVQTAMSSVAGDIQELLPVLRELKRQREVRRSAPKVIRKVVSASLIDSLSYENAEEARLQLRDIVRDTIKQIRITKKQGGNWYTMLDGEIELHTGEVVTFRYAYCSRRDGLVMCDGRAWSDPRNIKTFINHAARFPIPLMAETITDEVIAELKKRPTRSQVEKRAKLIEASCAVRKAG